MTADKQTYSLLTPDITNTRQQIIIRARSHKNTQIIISAVIIQIYHGKSGVVLSTSMRAQLPDIIKSQIMGYTMYLSHCHHLDTSNQIKPDTTI